MIGLVTLSSLSAGAASYDCHLSDGTRDDADQISYKFDTATEHNKFVDIGNGDSVGCVVLRANPQLVGCGLGREQDQSFVIAEDGTSILSLQTLNRGTKTVLNCVKTSKGSL